MKLCQPIEVGAMTFKNRIYHLPIGTPGHRGETALNYYKARARGGVAALTTGGLANMEILRHPTDDLKRFAAEIKVRRDLRYKARLWRDKDGDPLDDGLRQLGEYLDRLGLDEGTLILFDQRSDAPPVTERCSRDELEHGGRRITVLRL